MGQITALDEKENQERFLESFIEAHGDSSEARRISEVSRKTFFRWLEDREFRDRFDNYRLRLAEDIENEAVRRILKGKGQKGSDQLLMKTLAGLKPERYRDTGQIADNRTVVYVSNVRTEPRPGVEVLDGNIRADRAIEAGVVDHFSDPVPGEGSQVSRGDDSPLHEPDAGDSGDEAGPEPVLPQLPERAGALLRLREARRGLEEGRRG